MQEFLERIKQEEVQSQMEEHIYLFLRRNGFTMTAVELSSLSAHLTTELVSACKGLERISP